MNLETEAYRKFTGPAEHHKAVNSFLGLLDGIAIDGMVDEKETQELKNWYDLYRPFIDRHPFSEILPVIEDALEDDVLTYDEVEALRWLCRNVDSHLYYDLVTSSIQTLQGILHGIMANNTVTDSELKGLYRWLQVHFILKDTYPFDEIYSLLSSILADGVVTDDERNVLKAFFSEFVDTRDSYNLNEKELIILREQYSVTGICAKNPEIIFEGNTFCFTGASAKACRKDIEALIYSHDGECSGSVTKKTKYLIVGAEGNPCWAFSCYGRKIEKAVELRKSGYPIVIVNEYDFWAALEK
ncbi:MAG: BRCT domain-containing protein [Clostridia bacterium]|nr:BRCT domain-containing protein [Clostridia bacterium]